MCSFDWEKWLLFIYSTWEKECAPSLKRVEKPLWRKKDPCTTTRDIDYHCSYWRHVTFTCVIIEHDTWHWIPVWSKLRRTISKILYSVLWAYLRLCTCPSRKRGHCKKKQYGLEKICWDNLKCLNPRPVLWRLSFSTVYIWVNAHYIYQVQDNFFLCVRGCFIKIQERNNKK